ncbi:MAG: DEAD/DEAH box helicase [Pyrinomonadaceae bacterium]
MITLPNLYPHQESLRDSTRAALAKHGRVILHGDCGLGKTRIAKWIMGASVNRDPLPNQSGFSLFVVQGRPLVRNASESFSQEPELRHGIIMSGESPAYGCRTQVASIDTALSWFIENGEYRPDMTFDLIIQDEADNHLPKFARFLKVHDAKREQLGQHPAYVIGPTATPRAQGLADVYRGMVHGPTAQWLIDNQFLSPIRYFRGTPGKLGLLVMRGGEYTSDSEAAAMDGLSGDLVRDWKRHAECRPTVGFFPRRSHARNAMAELTTAGLRVAYVDCETPDEERSSIFWALDNYKIDYLCNVDIVGRGTDVPAISCIQLCVAMGSVRPFLQKIGRGTRFNPEKYPGKKDLVVIDHALNVGRSPGRHGFYEDDRDWSLDITTKEPGDHKSRPTIECPRCSAIYRGGRCRQCGYEPSQRERRGQGLDFDGTELKEVTREERKPAAVQSAEALMISALYKAGKSGRTWRQCCGIFKSLCAKHGTSYRVPSRVTVGGHAYSCPRWGDDNTNRRVSQLFPFTVHRAEHGGEYLVEDTQTAGAPY